ncbi:hypothetical protein A7K94_0217790 [Modestobacter sp. VKM Ac-2676]|nr:hypothetical protein A7K94_0217790 [Modestobacter sp. VKM Ac-2676]
MNSPSSSASAGIRNRYRPAFSRSSACPAPISPAPTMPSIEWFTTTPITATARATSMARTRPGVASRGATGADGKPRS